jgi:hypothetical protein
MSLYREVGQSRTQSLVAAGIALLVGLAIGYLLSESRSEEEPSIDKAIAALRADVSPVFNGLDLLPTEYGQAVRNGEIAAQTEYDGSVSNVERIQATLSEYRDQLEQLDPQATAQLIATVDEIQRAVTSRADPDEIDALRKQASAQLALILPSASS